MFIPSNERPLADKTASTLRFSAKVTKPNLFGEKKRIFEIFLQFYQSDDLEHVCFLKEMVKKISQYEMVFFVIIDSIKGQGWFQFFLGK